MIKILVMLMMASPMLALLIHGVMKSRPGLAARWAGYAVGLGGLLSLGLLLSPRDALDFTYDSGLNFSSLNILFALLIFMVSFVVHRFSLRYMAGDRLFRRYYILLAILTTSAMLMAVADDWWVFWLTWLLSNVLLVVLMIHKSEWAASRWSGWLALRTLGLGSVMLGLALLILHHVSSAYSFSSLIMVLPLQSSTWTDCALLLLMLAAVCQSALWPCHRWLLSSLNSPTPVSALMHAGLINGGGVLMVKFAPLWMMHSGWLMILFVLGAVTAALGTLWKLMQTDIKKMLACSTMAQMGFMMMQCGVGLFAAAVAHLCWHGLFKAYLFLSSGSALTLKKSELMPSRHAAPTTVFAWLLSLLGGGCAVLSLSSFAQKISSWQDPHLLILCFVGIAGMQLAKTLLAQKPSWLGGVVAVAAATIFGLVYGLSIHCIEVMIPSLTHIQAQPWTFMHGLILSLFVVMWWVMNGIGWKLWEQSWLGPWLYMNLWNASQPSEKTITSVRYHYHY